jgi:hypothetical protein
MSSAPNDQYDSLTLSQTKGLLRCMAHEQSLLLSPLARRD